MEFVWNTVIGISSFHELIFTLYGWNSLTDESNKSRSLNQTRGCLEQTKTNWTRNGFNLMRSSR